MSASPDGLIRDLPERIDCPGFSLRRARESDAELVAGTVAANLDHLGAWMPWAVPSSAAAGIAAQREWLAGVMTRSERGLGYEYLAFSPDEASHLGGFGLERRIGPGGIELGYWLSAEATGHGYATAAAGLLTQLALGLPAVERVEIHCDEANVRSRAVPSRLGFRFDRVEPVAIKARAETGRRMIWIYPPE